MRTIFPENKEQKQIKLSDRDDVTSSAPTIHQNSEATSYAEIHQILTEKDMTKQIHHSNVVIDFLDPFVARTDRTCFSDE